MKKVKYSLFGIIIFCITAQAQTASETDIIKRDITIEKPYEPSIMSAGKENELPAIADPDLKKFEADYSPYSTTLAPPYEVQQLDAARAKMPSFVERKEGYLRLGAGNFWGTLGDFMYPLLKKAQKDRLDISLHHKGTFGKRKHHKSDIDLAYRHYFNAGELMLDFDYGMEGFNYYGDNKLDDSTEYNFAGTTFLGKDYFKKNAQISRWNFTAGYQSFPLKDLKNHFTFLFNYQGFAPNYGLKEHVFNTDIKYNRRWNKNRFGADLRMENLLYNADQNLYGGQKNYTLVRLTPYFDFLYERWQLRLGVKLNFSGEENRAFAPAADISTQITLAEKILYFYGGITGDLQTNTQSQMVGLNHYIDLNQKIRDTYTPFDVYGGFKFKLIYNFLTDLSVSYKHIQDMFFFVNNAVVDAGTGTQAFANVFGVRYSNANLFNISLKFDYNLNHKFGFLLAGKYNGWKVKDEAAAWQLPQWEFDAGVDVKITKRFSANLYAYAATGRKEIIINPNTQQFVSQTMKGIFDLNLGLYYAHNSRLSAFVKLNNLLNRKHDQWHGYRVNGLNLLAGLVFAF